ncbi:histidine phosphatase family protein [Paenibacillus sp. GCM10027627]|uniref:histidine phosphatase family protein n=1 Tax=unclassified Paenibacillus TaxID=185978 RepID=UPI0036430FF0
MLIGLIRHGKTDWNLKGIIQGQTDIPLNEEGIMQARALARRLQEETKIWDLVVSSDLGRAQHTAAIIAEALQISVLDPDPRLRERFFGEVEGTTEEERIQRWGPDWRESGVQQLGMESDEAVRARGKEAIADMMKLHPDQNILLVSHGSFLAQMLQELCSDLTDTRIGNLSYSVLSLGEQGWQPVLHNCTRHLETIK